MRRILACVLVLACAACAQHPTRIQGTGERVSPPNGWTEYCHRHPSDVDCRAWFATERRT